MGQVIQYALLGLALGALYAMASQGLILVYRGSGVLNFGHGAIGITAAYVEYDLAKSLPTAVAFVVGVAVSAALGAVTYLCIMRPLRRASPLTRVVATLGVLLTLQSILLIRFGANALFPNNILPSKALHLGDGITVPEDRFILLGIALVLCVGLAAAYRYTLFGMATTAVAENERASAAVGWSPDAVAAINWALGSAFAGIAAILVVPIVTLQPSILTSILISSLATALVANFRSFSLAFGAAMVIGIAQTELTRYVAQPGLPSSVPFVIVILVLVLRGQAIPLRDFFLQRLPAVGDGRLRPGKIVFGLAVATTLFLVTSLNWVDALTLTMGTALVGLSVVVLTGYAGQLSLAQYALAGFGAWVAGRLMAGPGLPFWLACILGVAAAVPLGVLFALPAVRTRGINLAVITLGLGSALELILFDNTSYTGGFAGTVISAPHLFGINVSAVSDPRRYAFLTLIALVVASVVVANVRRGRTGGRLLAVRTNERAAAALGINVSAAKLYAFGLSAALAAAGGIALAFTSTAIDYSNFTSMMSISIVAWTVIGGIGFVVGPIIGGTFAPGALGNQITQSWIPGLNEYVSLIGGVSVILLVLQNQNGAVQQTSAQVAWLAHRLRGRIPSLVRGQRQPTFARLGAAAEHTGNGVSEARRVAPRKLVVSGLTVRYGSVVAVEDVSLTVEPGKIVGVIGPNGAGKTTLIDALTGFTPVTSGTISLGNADEVERWPAFRRARGGLARSFQSLELFEDATVMENLRTAADPHDLVSFFYDLVHPVTPRLGREVMNTIEEFGLAEELDATVQDLSYGRRRLVAVARAAASLPSILMLDEPAAGLSEVESREVSVLVRRLADESGMGILLVEHDMNFVMSVCDEIVVLDFGQMIAQGTPATIRNDPAVIAAYLGQEQDDARVPAGASVPAVGTAPIGVGSASDGEPL